MHWLTAKLPEDSDSAHCKQEVFLMPWGLQDIASTDCKENTFLFMQKD